jgi:hypothetical protein
MNGERLVSFAVSLVSESIVAIKKQARLTLIDELDMCLSSKECNRLLDDFDEQIKDLT